MPGQWPCRRFCGVPMAEVAKAEGSEPSMGQSPFAIARGRGFERVLFENDAERLRKALLEAGVISEEDVGFRDLRLRLQGGPMPDLDSALRETTLLCPFEQPHVDRREAWAGE